MNKSKKRVLSLIPIVSISMTSTLNTYAVINYNLLEDNKVNLSVIKDDEFEIEGLDKVEIKNFGCSEEVNKALSKIEFLLDNYSINKNTIYLEKAIELFGDIGAVAKEEDLEYFENTESTVYKFFYNIRESIYDIKDESIAGDYLVEFAKEILFGWRKNKISILFTEIYLVMEIIEYNEGKIENIQESLNELKSAYHYMINTNEENTDSEILPEIKYDIEENENINPPVFDYGQGNIGGEENNNDNDKENIDISNDVFTKNTYYKVKNKACVLVEQEYKNGQLFSEKENYVSKEDYVYCGIYDNIFSNVPVYKPNVVIDKDYIETNQNEESNEYIFYTITKDKIIPYYYNTGIRVDSDGSTSYNQLKDVFYQLAIKKNEPFVIANEKALFIINGSPIVLSSEKDVYSKNEVENLLSSFNDVGFIIDEKVDNLSVELEEIISSNDYATIKYKEEEYILNNIYFENSFIVASIQEVFGYFGYESKINGKKMTITKNGYKLELNLNNNIYILNGEEGILDMSIISKEDGWYLSLENIAKLMGYSVEWNSEELYFEIK